MAINNVVITGNLTKDVELKNTQSGKSVANMSVAVSRRFNKDETDFFDVQLWGKIAEVAAEYLRKGSKVGIIGSLQQQRWEKDGKKFSKVIINGDQLEFLDSKKKDDGLKGEDITDTTDDFPFDF